MMMLRAIGRRTAKFAIGFFGWYLLLIIPAMLAAMWFAGGGRAASGQQPDPVLLAAFPGDWLESADSAVADSVDPSKPDQQPYKLTTPTLAALRMVGGERPISDFAPTRIAAMLRPLFEYKTYPVSTVTRWEECTTVEVPADVLNAHGRTTGDPASQDGNTETSEVSAPKTKTECTYHVDTENGEVSLLHLARQYDGVTTHTYREITTARMENGKEITHKTWEPDRTEYQPDLSRLMDALSAHGFEPPDRYTSDFYFHLNSARTDPMTGDPWQNGGGWYMPGKAYSGTVDPGLPKDGWYWPAPSSSVITDPFGWRTHPIRFTRNFHTGLDVGDSIGSPLIAVRSGVVTFAKTGHNGGYGNRVIISLDNGAHATYSHLSVIQVREGEVVSAGQIIGTVGSTGNSTGPHLHFELLVNGEFIDPMPYYRR